MISEGISSRRRRKGTRHCMENCQSPKVSKIYCAPGNGGISEIAECVDMRATDIDGMVKFAKDNQIDLTVVAPDNPLALGMVDALEEKALRHLGQ